MNLGEWILLIAALTLVGLKAIYRDEQRATPSAYSAAAQPPAYHPQGLLWIDETMEQTTWWGDGAVIQSTH